MIGNGNNSINRFGSTVTFDTLNNRVFNDEVFTINKRFSIASGETFFILIDATAFDKNTFVVLPFTIAAYDAGPLTIDTYADVIYTGGTIWPSKSRKIFDPQTTGKVFAVSKPTISDPGTKLDAEYSVFSNGVPSSRKIAGRTKEDLILWVEPLRVFGLEITNTTSTVGMGEFSWSHFEV